MLLRGLVSKYWKKNLSNLNDLKVQVIQLHSLQVKLVIVRKLGREMNCWTDNNIYHYNVIDRHLRKVNNSNYLVILKNHGQIYKCLDQLLGQPRMCVHRDGNGREDDSLIQWGCHHQCHRLECQIDGPHTVPEWPQ